jgi:hypothetical protein
MAIDADHCIVCAAEDWWYGHDKWWNSESMACSTSSYILQFRETDGRISIQLAQLKRHTVMPTSNVRPMSKEAREVGLGRELRCQNGGSGRISNKRISRNRVLWWHVWHMWHVISVKTDPSCDLGRVLDGRKAGRRRSVTLTGLKEAGAVH